MSKEITVLAYNACDAFGRPDEVETNVKLVEDIRPNLAFISEGFKEDANITKAHELLAKLGYHVAAKPYEDHDNRSDRHGYMALSDQFSVGEEIRLGGRNAHHLRVPELNLDAIELHGFDRDNYDVKKSEEARLKQIEDIPYFEGNLLVMGDLNAMATRSLRALMLRGAKPIATLLPASEPGKKFEGSTFERKAARVGSLMQRVCEMADGRTLAELEKRGLRDADPSRKATKGPFTLDHIFVSKGIEVASFEVIKTNLSDHKPIVAKLRMG